MLSERYVYSLLTDTSTVYEGDNRQQQELHGGSELEALLERREPDTHEAIEDNGWETDRVQQG